MEGNRPGRSGVDAAVITVAAAQLAKAGEIARAEADLLVAETHTIRNDIYREPPTDFKVTCYDMALPPAGPS